MNAVKHYIAAVSQASGLAMPAQRQALHTAEFRRLLSEANMLSALMGHDAHLTVTPITVLRHDEHAAAVAVSVQGKFT